MVKWVNLGFTKKDNWRHVKRGLKTIPLAKPVRLIEDPAIRTAGHLAAHPPVPAGGTAKIEEHAVFYNPRYPAFGASIVHELAHAKVCEDGFYCFPYLQGGDELDWMRSWTWIDEHYAYQTFRRYSEELLIYEVALKINLIAQLSPRMYNLWTESGLCRLVHDVMFIGFQELWAAELGLPYQLEKLEMAQEVWRPFFEYYPKLDAHKELFKSVLMELPPQEKLTREEYVEAGLKLLYSKFITKENPSVPIEKYRENVLKTIVKVTA